MALRSQIRSFLKGINTQQIALDVLYRAAIREELPRDIANICYGIDYAINTGRLPGKVDYEVRKLTPYKMGQLVAYLYENNIKQSGDVPRALINKYVVI